MFPFFLLKMTLTYKLNMPKFIQGSNHSDHDFQLVIHTSSWMSSSATGLVSRLRLGRTNSQKYVTKRVECTFFWRGEGEMLIIMICIKMQWLFTLVVGKKLLILIKTRQTFFEWNAYITKILKLQFFLVWNKDWHIILWTIQACKLLSESDKFNNWILLEKYSNIIADRCCGFTHRKEW